MSLKSNTLYYLFGLLFITILSHLYFGFSVNLTNSLPYKIFIINKLSAPSVGNYICFKAPLESGFPENTILTKKILAGPGDVVSKKGLNFYINDQWVSKAKSYSWEGEELVLGPEGVLKEGEYYVGGFNADSMDSRYQVIGWINREQIIAVSYPIF